MAVTEETEFQEPIVVYTTGQAFNLYQIMMDTQLPFNYRAIWPDEYSSNHSHVKFNKEHDKRKNKIAFREDKFKPWGFPQEAKSV